MEDLRKFVVEHAERGPCRCGKCVDHPGEDSQPQGHTADVYFFEVSAKDDPDPEQLRQLITAAKQGDFCELDPFDGEEHSYLEIGGWIGDQGLALTLMGLGAVCGLWSLMTPKMLPDLPEEMMQMMAGMGMVSIVPRSTVCEQV